jgi:hypothetical protein
MKLDRNWIIINPLLNKCKENHNVTVTYDANQITLYGGASQSMYMYYFNYLNEE